MNPELLIELRPQSGASW